MHQLIPHFIAQKMAEGQLHGRVQSATLCIDIVGFTNLTEHLLQRGKSGAAALADEMNHTFGTILQLVYAAGGFVHLFAGDALLVVFPQQKSKQPF
jgi:class 3 adenylate cyclase